eukprot:TRINITY_DN2390_c0_g1_i1.p1 TRINITY_DN2390_c0_g1~~TRINITY_DN2390_c0_g1_i1.p1  ORF type:complete len:354 (-),score=66.34 TRINITY_DN2390_c0_g1_i1:317-1378(-)
MSQKKVVVVGGGVGGSLVAKKLELVADVTLIDPKDYFEVPYAGLRVIVEPEFAEKSTFLHSEYLKTATHVLGSASSVSDEHVVTSDGRSIPYDFLVISSGSAFTGPATRSERLNDIKADNSKVIGASSILIVGGGPVGVELAGEIVTDFPTKKVTLVQSGSRLLEFIGPKASTKTLDWLVSKKVEVILDDRVEFEDGSSAAPTSTKNGKPLSATAHFVTVGRKVGSAWLKESSLSSLLDQDGRLKVGETLAVEGKTNIFAVGDITNIKENKQGYSAGTHAGVVVKNIKTLIKTPDAKKLATYKASKPLAIVSLGRKSAVAQLPIGTFLGKFPAALKSKNLFVDDTRKKLGVAA